MVEVGAGNQLGVWTPRNPPSYPPHLPVRFSPRPSAFHLEDATCLPRFERATMAARLPSRGFAAELFLQTPRHTCCCRFLLLSNNTQHTAGRLPCSCSCSSAHGIFNTRARDVTAHVLCCRRTRKRSPPRSLPAGCEQQVRHRCEPACRFYHAHFTRAPYIPHFIKNHHLQDSVISSATIPAPSSTYALAQQTGQAVTSASGTLAYYLHYMTFSRCRTIQFRDARVPTILVCMHLQARRTWAPSPLSSYIPSC